MIQEKVEDATLTVNWRWQWQYRYKKHSIDLRKKGINRELTLNGMFETKDMHACIDARKVKEMSRADLDRAWMKWRGAKGERDDEERYRDILWKGEVRGVTRQGSCWIPAPVSATLQVGLGWSVCGAPVVFQPINPLHVFNPVRMCSRRGALRDVRPLLSGPHQREELGIHKPPPLPQP